MLLLAMQINSPAWTGPAALPPPAFLHDEQPPRFALDFEGPFAGTRSAPKSPDTPKVLLVDDSEQTLARATAVLSAGRGCVVVGTATNGCEALEAAAALSPDVVVLDISMPDMNGFELARRLRGRGCTAPLVFLTVHEEEELVLAAKNAGALGYVVKTRIASDLELAVREARDGKPFQSPSR
jgi:DNA-binding NarL/FixJ family response regulator